MTVGELLDKLKDLDKELNIRAAVIQNIDTPCVLDIKLYAQDKTFRSICIDIGKV